MAAQPSLAKISRFRRKAIAIPCIAPVKHCEASDITARPIPAAVAGSMNEVDHGRIGKRQTTEYIYPVNWKEIHIDGAHEASNQCSKHGSWHGIANILPPHLVLPESYDNQSEWRSSAWVRCTSTKLALSKPSHTVPLTASL